MAKLTAAQLRAMPAEDFGLPETRQYPMPDKTHVIKAIQFFSYCPDDKKKELAKNINDKAKELGVDSKIQPSSSFFKYANKKTFSVSDPIKEFHIGQLSPIVGIQPVVIKPPSLNDTRMDKLRHIWKNRSSDLNTKNNQTLDLLKEASNDQDFFNTELMVHIEAISDLNYMLREYTDFKVLECGIVPTDGLNYAASSFDEDINVLNVIIQEISNGDHGDLLGRLYRMIRNPAIKIAAISAINYSTNLTPNQKFNINCQAFGDVFTSSSGRLYSTLNKLANKTSVDLDIPPRYRLSEEDHSKINELVRLGTDVFVQDFCSIINPQDFQVVFKWVISKGLHILVKNIGEKCAIIIKSPDSSLEVVTRVNYDVNSNIGTHVIHTDKLVAFNRPEYNEGVKTTLMTGKFPDGFKYWPEGYTFIDKNIKLEAIDFTDLVKGAEIGVNGNIAYNLTSDTPLSERIKQCGLMMAQALQSEDYDNYKINLAFLFATITRAFEEKKDLKVIQTGIDKFNAGIDTMNKKEKKFDFVGYYYNNCYQIFNLWNDITDKDQIVSAIKMAYMAIRR